MSGKFRAIIEANLDCYECDRMLNDDECRACVAFGMSDAAVCGLAIDHALLMENVIEAMNDLPKCPICASRGVDGGHAEMCPVGILNEHRKGVDML